MAVEIGKMNKLKVLTKVDFGVYLDGRHLGEILLPFKYLPAKCEEGDIVEVFIYLDSEDRLIATTETPYAMVGEFAYLRVSSVTNVGAFLNWGLAKDLLVPFREQKTKMQEGRSYVVRVYLDELTRRIAASSRLDKFLDNEAHSFKDGDKVDLIICNQTDIGYNAVVNNSHWGVIYKNEIFQELRYGQKVEGFIKRVREDKKIDLCLQQPGYGKVGDISDTILEALKDSGGFLPLTSKSSPEEISATFKVSKKVFKMAIGALYKKRLITIEDDGIRLTG